MISKTIWTVVILWGLCIAYGNDWTRVLKAAIASEGELEFYGKVVDQEGHLVKEIRVLYETSSAGFPGPIYRKGYVKTDTNGLFVIKGGHIGILYIKGMEKPGYELQKLPPSFDYRQDYRYRHKPDKEKPVEFVVRRKDNKGFYLLRKDIAVMLSMELKNGKADGRNYGRDFSKGISYSYSLRHREDVEDAFWDIEATGEADKENGVWNVVLKTNGKNSGIQRLDSLLHEAPEDGYAKEISLAIPFGMAKTRDSSEDKLACRHFYARLREPGMYARLDVDEIQADEMQLMLYCKVLINPYGDRSLEELTFLLKKLSYSEKNGANASLRAKINKSLQLESDDCERPAMQAMREQRFAECPPFDEWMKEGLVFW